MGCFLGCFGDTKDRKNGKKQRIRSASPQVQSKLVKDVNPHSQVISVADQGIQVTTQPGHLVSELQNKPREEEQLSPSPKKRVTFDSNVITHEHVSVFDSTDSLNESNGGNAAQKENLNSIPSNTESYPPNHRYYNARDSDDEAEDCDDSDLDDLDHESDYEDDHDEGGGTMDEQEAWSITENHSVNMISGEVDDPVDEKAKTEGFGSETRARERRDYANSVLNPVENIVQWKSAKSKVAPCTLKPEKENMLSCSEVAPSIAFSTEPTIKKPSFKTKSDLSKDQEVAVDASLSNWLISPNPGSSERTVAKWSNSDRSLEDRPILGALTAEELKQVLATSSPKKLSPNRNPDDMPIIGTVGAYWIHSTTN